MFSHIIDSADSPAYGILSMWIRATVLLDTAAVLLLLCDLHVTNIWRVINMKV